MTSEILIGFLLGILGSFIASYCYDTIKTMIVAKRQKLEIEGTWGEFVRDSKGRQFSLGKIYWDKRRKIYRFDGTNYANNGEAYCHFHTVLSYIDYENEKFFYVFNAKVEGDLGQLYYGFGVVNLAKDERGRLAPVNGHYVSASVDGRGMSHSMVRAVGLEYAPNVEGERVVAFIRSKTPKTLQRVVRPSRG